VVGQALPVQLLVAALVRPAGGPTEVIRRRIFAHLLNNWAPLERLHAFRARLASASHLR